MAGASCSAARPAAASPGSPPAARRTASASSRRAAPTWRTTTSRDNSGWGVHLFRSTHNTIVRNQAIPHAAVSDAGGRLRRRRRARARGQRLQHHRRQRSHLLGHRRAADRPGAADPGLGRATWSTGTTPRSPRSAAFVARGIWSVTFLENRADSAATGFELTRLSGGTIRGQHRDRGPARRHRGHARRGHQHREQRAARCPGGHPRHDAGLRLSPSRALPDR